LKIKVVGVYREKYFSNHAIEADKKILDTLLNGLDSRYFNVVARIAPDSENIPDGYDLYLTMAQGLPVLNRMEEIERKGAMVINSAIAIRNCFRSKMSYLFKLYGIKAPEEYNVSLVHEDVEPAVDFENGYWVKRGDYHSVEDADVVFVSSLHDYRIARDYLKNKGVKSLVLQRHIEGDIYKFYGVSDNFFTPRFMGSTSRDRTKLNDAKTVSNVDMDALRRNAFKTASLFGLDFYGGDFIVTSSGDFFLVDLNDWPSFRTCCLEVAPHMVYTVCQKLKLSMETEIQCHLQEDFGANLTTV